MNKHEREVINILKEYNEICGIDLRNILNNNKWFKWSVTGFYQLMANLVNKGYVNRIIKSPNNLHWFSLKDNNDNTKL
jgi:hypothetical protein